MALTQTMIDVLVFVEQVYYEDGKVPTPEKISEVVGVRVDTVRGYWKSQDFRNAVLARGVTLEGMEDAKALTYEQLLVANMLMNPSDKRSLRAKLEDPSVAQLKVSPQQVNGWMRSKTFTDHLQKRAKALFGSAEPAAYTNFVKAIEAGDQKAIALYFEMRGIYNPRLTVDINISSVLVRVVEIVSKHVRDPAILAAIAEEMDGLDVGSTMGAVEMPILDAVVSVPNKFTT